MVSCTCSSYPYLNVALTNCCPCPNSELKIRLILVRQHFAQNLTSKLPDHFLTPADPLCNFRGHAEQATKKKLLLPLALHRSISIDGEYGRFSQLSWIHLLSHRKKQDILCLLWGRWSQLPAETFQFCSWCQSTVFFLFVFFQTFGIYRFVVVQWKFFLKHPVHEEYSPQKKRILQTRYHWKGHEII